jgi:hypothetical protein
MRNHGHERSVTIELVDKTTLTRDLRESNSKDSHVDP